MTHSWRNSFLSFFWLAASHKQVWAAGGRGCSQSAWDDYIYSVASSLSYLSFWDLYVTIVIFSPLKNVIHRSDSCTATLTETAQKCQM